jgi:glycerophosphoryl diester phosphodiesterase
VKDHARIGRAVLPAVAVAGVGLAIAGLVKRNHRPGAPYLAGAPLLIAHRGGSALAPENTLLAFERAVEWWRADILELDVHPTRDGEIVVIHDPNLDRTTDGRGLVREWTLADLRRLDAGYRFTPDAGTTHPFRGRDIGIPTLSEVLTSFPTTRVNIEIKDGRAQDGVWRSIVECGAQGRVLVAAGRKRDRSMFDDGRVPISAAEEDLRIFIAQMRIGAVMYVPPVDAFQVPDRWGDREISTRAFIHAAAVRNIPVHVWTIDEVGAMNELFDRGVTGIVTDRPDRLARVLHDRVGRPLPSGAPNPLPEPFLETLLGD